MTDHREPRSGEGPVPSGAEIDDARRRVESALDRHGLSLEDPGLWMSPDVALPDGTAPGAEPAAEPSSRPAWWRWLAVAAVLVAVVGVSSLMLLRESPDWSVELGPTDDFPMAAATIDGWNEETGTRLLLTITGVDPAPDGYFYEMWMSEGPVHISAGTFVDVAGVELRAAVARRDYPRLWVTLEPIDEDESPNPIVVVDSG